MMMSKHRRKEFVKALETVLVLDLVQFVIFTLLHLSGSRSRETTKHGNIESNRVLSMKTT